MGSAPRSRRLGLIAAFSIVTLGLPGPAHAQLESGPPDNSHDGHRVTLITGDRVTVSAGPKPQVSVEPGPGRRSIHFSIRTANGRIQVLPSDVGGQIAAGRLDPQLFDVAALIKAGYDDSSAKAIPVIVTYTGSALRHRAAAPGATVTRLLPTINGVAAKVNKAEAGAFLAGTTAARAATGVRKIWLDGKRRLNLDQSVPQIGAPVAWQAGYTGKGVTVAVLDSGIDTSHPDLATQVAGAKNFTDTPDGDHYGHGTHVASTIAGTAAASAGRYKGVAPDAKLYDGKVCDGNGGCEISAIVAGMEWAATEVGARIVNLSLGSPDTLEVDPLEEAVNRLTAETGALFVVSAGNDGPGAGTVGSPGSAEAALTVGAVDKQDKLADFSSRGPRVGDGGLKPDVTAPGVGIVAAKAKDSVIGTPVGDRYLQLDGTSMAAPHVAGAAALLAQQHPDWKAADLKGALMASAMPAAEQSLFEQGAGRIDVGRAVQQSVVAEPGSLSFGVVEFPHDDDVPVTKPLTYRNFGDQAVTLGLASTMSGPDGRIAPVGAVQLSAQSVTVPAHGTAVVQVTVNTKHDGANGVYTGRVTATAGSLTVGAAIAVTKETEHYLLTVKAVGPDGEPGTFEFGSVDSIGTGEMNQFFGTGEVSFRLPKGEYEADTTQFLPDPDDPEAAGRSYKLVQPHIDLSHDTTSVIDARIARPVSVTVPAKDARIVSAYLGFARQLTAPGGGELTSFSSYPDFATAYLGQVGPSVAPAAMTGFVTSQWAVPGSDGKFRNSPYVYGLFNAFPGGFPTGFRRDVRATDLAVVDHQLNAASTRAVQFAPSGSTGDMFWSFGHRLEYSQPRTVRLLLDAQPVRWSTGTYEIVPGPDPHRPEPVEITSLRSDFRQYAKGTSYRQRSNAAAFTTKPDLAVRDKNTLVIWTHRLMDADGNYGETAVDTSSSRLLRNGVLVAEGSLAGIGVDKQPPEQATYRLESTQTRQTYAAFSTRTDRTWTFTSAATTQSEQLPAIGIRYLPTVDIGNIADRTPTTVLPIALETQYQGTLPKIRSVAIEVSGDEGATWTKATVTSDGRGGYRAAFATPKAAKSVSLKARIVDCAGNVTEDTTIGAYPLR